MPDDTPALILASTSSYRRTLLERLGLPFAVEAPGIDEAAAPGEAPAELAARLAAAKACAVGARRAGAVVIGSDQVAECGGQVLGKPLSVANARLQLASASGRVVEFHTAVALLHADGVRLQQHTDRTRVRFRRLDAAAIAYYVEVDRPFDCAGSFRSEGLGAALLEAVETEDPTALVGLPLIWLAQALGRAGLDPLSAR